ncbi:oxaloacetate decarboxylase [Rhizobium leguminosarum]|uniref:isocitrate lyase/PEP mutase family protein n=1 Tax=Rhizobium leguminosarum TaxID=384 RepID=UPI001C971449|nr:isocitrate lyase/PEP mutase family protein [Rhizobium leguminosarum]MBY5377283.1 isocitrate lyase/PEP mutase family protein [Rhizobium leguminosarum]
MQRNSTSSIILPATARRQRLRAAIAGPHCIAPVSVFDPISARIAHELGFPAMMLAGSVAAVAVLGAPDMAILTLSELVDLARRICRVSDVPLIVDADHGYGNALNVRRTIEELEQAGVSAVTIEDTLLPDPFGSGGVPSLIPLEEAVGKIKAALSARSDPNFMIIGRTGGAGLADTDEIRRRLCAFAAAGADMVFVRGVETATQLKLVTAGLETPVFLGTSNRDLANVDRLSDTAVRIVLKGHLPMMSAYQAVHEAMASQLDGRSPPPALSARDLERLTGQDSYEQFLEAFLGGGVRRESHHL